MIKISTALRRVAKLISPDQVEPADAEVMASVGIHVEDQDRSGTYILRDFYPLCALAQTGGLELLPIAEALQKYDWLREKYYWKAVPADLDEYTARCAAAAEPQGYFVHVKRGAKVPFPVQACLYITRGDIAQMIHNVVILEEDSELHLITGCATRHGVSSAAHLGVSEHYIGRNASLTSTMVHSWGPEVEVRPRSGTIVEAGGSFVSNYCSLRPARSIQSEPRTWLNGEGAAAKYLTIILGSRGSTIDTGGDVYLNAEDTSAELAHRAVCTGGHIYQRGLLVGNAPGCRAHVDCAGMVLDAGEDGFIEAVPGLRSLHPEARMSHEASIGKIAPEQVAYLQSRGMSEREAISMIIRGFLGEEIVGLSPELDARVAEIAEVAGHGEE
ncbi:MAG TPA: SufD family Fe-S cluster assembly protein [Chloroflexi bacterium]|nr:SufD family Fe-S cluster assembly protein [Chloroflexota bacterium]